MPMISSQNAPTPLPRTFEQDLVHIINKHSKESGSNTPDYILAEYMGNCLKAFHHATRLRDNWYGGKRSVINDQAEKWDDMVGCWENESVNNICA